MSSRVSIGVAGDLALLDRVEPERAPGGLDVVLNVRRLARLFVRRHDEALQQRAVDLAADATTIR